jgi:hypothetical protein
MFDYNQAMAPTEETYDVLECAQANLRQSRRLGFERLVLAERWAMLHVRRQKAWEAPRTVRLGAVELGVDEYAAAELGLALELHPLAAQRLMADAVDLKHRMPWVWASVESLELESWVARKIAASTRRLDADQAAQVDAAVAGLLGILSPGRLLGVVEARVVEADQAAADRLVEQARRQRLVRLGRDNEHGVRGIAIRADAADALRFYTMTDQIAHLLAANTTSGAEEPESIDELRARAVGILANPLLALQVLAGAEQTNHPTPLSNTGDPGGLGEAAGAVCGVGVVEAIAAVATRIRARSVLYLHLTPETLTGHGVTRAEQLGALTKAQLITLLGHEHITITPVIDLRETEASDNYEVPARIAERLHLTKPADVFPYAESLSRTLDRDHTTPYDPTGPPGQTVVDNLGKLTRRHHRVKTHAGWTVEQQPDGVYLWGTPHGQTRVTDHTGTHRVPEPPPIGRYDLVWAA